MSNEIIFGFDPGGDASFGVALLSGDEAIATTVSSVAEAIAWAKTEAGSRTPPAAGVDTLLHWSDVAGGWRPADKHLRSVYPLAKASVLSPNGLFGSMAIGGMALALRLKGLWPEIILNETHPKVLFSALSGSRYRKHELAVAIEWFFRHSGIKPLPIQNDHEFDALLSAWATLIGTQQNWSDLVDSNSSLIFPVGKVIYLWPPGPLTETVIA